MARASIILWRIFIPLLIAGFLSGSAYHFMVGRLMNSENLKMDEKCPKPWTETLPYQRRYLGGYAPQLEQILCVLVAFFDTVLKSEARHHTLPFVYDLLVSFGAPITVLYFEASRARRSLLLAFPFVVGILCQITGGGVVLPLYWGVVLAAGSQNASETLIVQASAEAVLFGIVMGFGLPTLAMAYFSTVETIALWQPFPLWITLFEQLHLLIRPRQSHSGSGYRTVQATYIMIFLASAAIHAHALTAYNFDPQVISSVYFPTIAEPRFKGATALTSCIHFLQWDMMYIFGSTLLASLWFAENILQGALLVTWNVVSTITLGPGAAVAGVFLWRESKLNRKRGKLAATIKPSEAS